MFETEFYLLTESCFTYCYLVEKWIENFKEWHSFKGVLLAEELPSSTIIERRQTFHRKYAGLKNLNDDIEQDLQELYPGFDRTERALVSLFGIPKYSTADYAQTFYLHGNSNGEYAMQWLKSVTVGDNLPFFFVNLGQILKPWWIEISQSRIINVHSAILPYARGIYSIENIAAQQDLQKFKQSVGVTVHYIDEGVDTGSIIRAKRVIDPFRFNSIWELKGYLYLEGFDMQIEIAKEIVRNKAMTPAGILQDPNLKGPNFKKKDFTLDRQNRAEIGYLAMKSQVKEHKISLALGLVD